MVRTLSRIAEKAHWRLRWIADRRPKGSREVSFRLNRLPSEKVLQQPLPRFQFPWGDVEYIYASDLRGQFQEIFLDRHYSFTTTVANPVIVDCGGNIGLSSIWFKQEYPGCKLIVYEADPQVAGVLSRNLRAAGMGDVKVNNMAVWNRSGFVSFDNRGGDAGLVSAGGSISVASADIAGILPDRVDLLKLDVEGAEFEIIERLCETGKIARIQNIAAEFHVRRNDTQKLLASLGALQKAGMKVAITAALGGWLGASEVCSPFESVGKKQNLLEVFAWRESSPQELRLVA